MYIMPFANIEGDIRRRTHYETNGWTLFHFHWHRTYITTMCEHKMTIFTSVFLPEISRDLYENACLLTQTDQNVK